MFGIEVQEGQSYIPGPIKCTLCKCVNQKPMFCKFMECDSAPPPKVSGNSIFIDTPTKIEVYLFY